MRELEEGKTGKEEGREKGGKGGEPSRRMPVIPDVANGKVPSAARRKKGRASQFVGKDSQNVRLGFEQKKAWEKYMV